MNEKPSYGNDYFGVTAKDMEHSFGIESSEAQTVKDNFQYDKPPAIVHESDFGKVFVWLETLANKKGLCKFRYETDCR